MKRTRIKRQSSKRAKEMREYRAQVKEWLGSAYWVCPVCMVRLATECHHKRGRMGRLLLDKRFWVPVCATCHKAIHDNPNKAREHGWLSSAAEFNTYPGTDAA